MKDGCNRNIDYIRISITDKCNLRCIYCMPEQGVRCLNHSDILSFEEIERLCKILVKIGISKIKITGGEPLVRRDCDQLIDKLHHIDGIESLTLTTNGVLLPKYIDRLVNVGLSGINISLDAWNAQSYEKITRKDNYKDTMEGIQAALQYPNLRIKINCVPMAETNEKDLYHIASLAKENEIHVRYIEMMPIGLGKNFKFMSEDHVIELLEKKFGKLTPYQDKLGNGPAHYYKVNGFKGKIGFISARSHKFCDQCNRIRLTSDGYLKTCLQYNEGYDLRKLLRNSSTDDEIEAVLKETIGNKPVSHRFEDIIHEDIMNKDTCEHRRMHSIGG